MGDEGSVCACGEAQTPDASSTSVETGIEGSISEAPDGTGGSADAAKGAIADSGVGGSTTERAKECTAPSVWDADRTCSICLEKFVVGQLARSLPCSHIFHAECIDSWLTQSSRACPEVRTREDGRVHHSCHIALAHLDLPSLIILTPRGPPLAAG